MKRNFFGAALAFAIALTASNMMAQDGMADPMQAMPEQSVVENYGDCCIDVCCGPSSHVYGEYQFLYLDNKVTEENFSNGLSTEDGHRLIVGYERCDGLGLRARWFHYDGSQVEGTGPNLDGLDLETIDIELTDRICICNWNGVISAGYRYAQYDAYDGDAPGDAENQLEMHGLTFGLQLERELTCNLGVYMWLQQSLLYGEDTQAGADIDNLVIGWTDAQLGLQYNTCIAGYNSVIRGGVEAQRHEAAIDTDTSDTGLIGFFISGGVTY